MLGISSDFARIASAMASRRTSDPEGTVPVQRERWLASSVVFLDLSGVPEFIELGADERIELL